MRKALSKVGLEEKGLGSPKPGGMSLKRSTSKAWGGWRGGCGAMATGLEVGQV
jgi:hypothetical protein